MSGIDYRGTRTVHTAMVALHGEIAKETENLLKGGHSPSRFRNLTAIFRKSMMMLRVAHPEWTRCIKGQILKIPDRIVVRYEETIEFKHVVLAGIKAVELARDLQTNLDWWKRFEKLEDLIHVATTSGSLPFLKWSMKMVESDSDYFSVHGEFFLVILLEAAIFSGEKKVLDYVIRRLKCYAKKNNESIGTLLSIDDDRRILDYIWLAVQSTNLCAISHCSQQYQKDERHLFTPSRSNKVSKGRLSIVNLIVGQLRQWLTVSAETFEDSGVWKVIERIGSAKLWIQLKECYLTVAKEPSCRVTKIWTKIRARSMGTLAAYLQNRLPSKGVVSSGTMGDEFEEPVVIRMINGMQTPLLSFLERVERLARERRLRIRWTYSPSKSFLGDLAGIFKITHGGKSNTAQHLRVRLNEDLATDKIVLWTPHSRASIQVDLALPRHREGINRLFIATFGAARYTSPQLGVNYRSSKDLIPLLINGRASRFKVVKIKSPTTAHGMDQSLCLMGLHEVFDVVMLLHRSKTESKGSFEQERIKPTEHH